MFNMKLPNGEGLFNTLEVKLACPDCLASDHPERCVHMTDEIPVSIGPLKTFVKKILTLCLAMEERCQV